MVFEAYSMRYNLLYKDKYYAGEAEHIHELLQTYVPNPKSILDLGCGTCIYGPLLANEDCNFHTSI